MKIWGWGLVFLFLFTNTISAQNVNRYLKKPLPQTWLGAQTGDENDGYELFQQTLPTEDQWWKLFGDTMLDSLIAQAVDNNYSVLLAINKIGRAHV